MDFKVIALERDEYDAWVEDMLAVEQEATAANAEAGYEAFKKMPAFLVMPLADKAWRQGQR